jgi:hypothetical protein
MGEPSDPFTDDIIRTAQPSEVLRYCTRVCTHARTHAPSIVCWICSTLSQSVSPPYPTPALLTTACKNRRRSVLSVAAELLLLPSPSDVVVVVVVFVVDCNHALTCSTALST